MSSQDFGIQKAIELMRNLPADNIPLVVQVVKATLESANVSVEAIVSDAEIKQAKIENRIDKLEGEIKDYQEEIEARREEIKALKSDFEETTSVREKLELSMQDPQDSGGLPSPSASVSKGKSTIIGSPLLKPASPKSDLLPGGS